MLSGGWEFHSNIHCTVEEKDHILVVHLFGKESSSFVAKSNATFRVRADMTYVLMSVVLTIYLVTMSLIILSESDVRSLTSSNSSGSVRATYLFEGYLLLLTVFEAFA